MKNLKLIKSKISKVKLGRNCKIIEPVNLYGCTIGKQTFIGPFNKEGEANQYLNSTELISNGGIIELQ